MANILVVDDNELLLAVVEDALRSAGYTVATASTYAQLTEQLERDTFDLILMDVHMPELYGDDVAQILRDTRGVKARVYLFSGAEEAELAERAATAGLDGHISKTLGTDEVVARVRAILGPT
jgi:DNA-binding response OmpR family regulator